MLLRGKHKPIFAPHVDTGDFVIIVNAAKVALTGNKREQKMYRGTPGFPGGLRQTPYAELLATRPKLAVEKAVKGMLPHNTLGRQMLSASSRSTTARRTRTRRRSRCRSRSPRSRSNALHAVCSRR